jgi:hypothetical protein
MMKAPDRPTQEEVDRLLEALGPKIERLFRRQGIPPEEAEREVDEALTALLYLWDRVRNPEWWLMDRLEKAALRLANPLPEEEP